MDRGAQASQRLLKLAKEKDHRLMALQISPVIRHATADFTSDTDSKEMINTVML